MWNGTHPICKVNVTELTFDEHRPQHIYKKATIANTVLTEGDIRFDIMEDSTDECNGERLGQIEPINMTR